MVSNTVKAEKTRKREEKATDKEKLILKMYFEAHQKPKDIAKKLKVAAKLVYETVHKAKTKVKN